MLPPSHQKEPAPATPRPQTLASGTARQCISAVKGTSLWHFVRTALANCTATTVSPGHVPKQCPFLRVGRLIIFLVSSIVTLNGGSFGNVWRHLRLSPWEGLLASSGQRPGMLLTIVRAQGSPATENYLIQNIDSAETANAFDNRRSPVIFSLEKSANTCIHSTLSHTHTCTPRDIHTHSHILTLPHSLTCHSASSPKEG